MLSLNHSAVSSSERAFSVMEIQPMSHTLPIRHVNFDDGLFFVRVVGRNTP
ncbi:hypothetical protein STW0522ENT51_03010 [Enterobacter kobei]|nr:hypothetical protein STW0522ENT51_03010 [Enterobacter kobei]